MEAVYALQVVRSNCHLCFMIEDVQMQVEGVDVLEIPQHYYSEEVHNISTRVSVKHMKSGLKYGGIFLEYEEFKSNDVVGTKRPSWFQTDVVDRYVFAITNCAEKGKRFHKGMFWFTVDAKELKTLVENQLTYFPMRTSAAIERANSKKEGRVYNGNYHYRIDLQYLRENLPDWAWSEAPVAEDCFKERLKPQEHNKKGKDYNYKLISREHLSEPF